MAKRPLTYKQDRFKDEYIANGGNGLQAAKAAGYSGNDNTLKQRAHELVTNSNVQAAIQTKNAAVTDDNNLRILNKLQLQAYWSRIVLNEGVDGEPGKYSTQDGLKSSELLAKSRGAFVTQPDTVHIVNVQPATPQAEAEQLKAKLARLERLADAPDCVQR